MVRDEEEWRKDGGRDVEEMYKECYTKRKLKTKNYFKLFYFQDFVFLHLSFTAVLELVPHLQFHSIAHTT